jgi:hypothetical protein
MGIFNGKHGENLHMSKMQAKNEQLTHKGDPYDMRALPQIKPREEAER